MERNPKKPSLAETHPELAKQWHTKRNGDLRPTDVTRGSRKKVWWSCEFHAGYEWEAVIDKRTSRGQGCPLCANENRKPRTPPLSQTHPELLGEWHPTKNGLLNPSKPIVASKKVWWICPVADDHEWEAKIQKRKGGQGCPICLGMKVVQSNSFAFKFLDLVKEIHPTKNADLNPNKIYFQSTKKIWWKCDKGEDHEWITSIKKRTVRGQGCPVCSSRKLVRSNSLGGKFPQLIKEWHPTKNKISPFEIHHGAGKYAWWMCNKNPDHDYKTLISNKTRHSTGCPFCDGKKTNKTNSFAALYPELLKELHPTKNKNLDPNQVFGGGETKVWWKCPVAEDHVWQTSIIRRTKGKKTGCPMCGNDIVVESNCLQTTHPEIAKEWHPTMNGSLTPKDIVAGSKKVIWWQCKNNPTHEWKTRAVGRFSHRGHIDITGCPYCNLTPQSRQELIITFELLKFFKDINPKGYKTRLNGKLRAIDIFIPDLNLAIEFDGSYWHKDKRAIDKIKSEMLMDEGYQVIRIREQPLKKIHENDIISKLPYNGKEITDNILKRILELYPVKGPLKQKIQNYISKDGLQNEKALDKYIDQILEEKAAKKK